MLLIFIFLIIYVVLIISFYFNEKLFIIFTVFLTMLPLKIIFNILELKAYFLILVLLTSSLSITLVYHHKNSRLPDLISILIAMFISIFAYAFICPLFYNVLMLLPYKEILIVLSNILFTYNITLSMNQGQDNSSFESAVDALINEVDSDSDSNGNKEELPGFRKELELLQKRGSRVLSNLNKFNARENFKQQAIDINNERLLLASKIDKIMGNSKTVDNVKKGELYRYVIALDNSNNNDNNNK